MPDKAYPRIWDWSGERKIVGETKVSWLVIEKRVEDRDIATFDDWQMKRFITKVSKKNPPDRWMFSEVAMNDHKYIVRHHNDIATWLQRKRDISADTLRQIAELIGYKPEEPHAS